MAFDGNGGHHGESPHIPTHLTWNGEAGSLRGWKKDLDWWLDGADISGQLNSFDGTVRYSLAARLVDRHPGSLRLRLRAEGLAAYKYRPVPAHFLDESGHACLKNTPGATQVSEPDLHKGFRTMLEVFQSMATEDERQRRSELRDIFYSQGCCRGNGEKVQSWVSRWK